MRIVEAVKSYLRRYAKKPQIVKEEFPLFPRVVQTPRIEDKSVQVLVDGRFGDRELSLTEMFLLVPEIHRRAIDWAAFDGFTEHTLASPFDTSYYFAGANHSKSGDECFIKITNLNPDKRDWPYFWMRFIDYKRVERQMVSPPSNSHIETV